MNEIEKLRHLVHHWKEHNEEHAEGYRQWAEKVGALGKKELSNLLMKLYEETKELNLLFENLIKEVEKDEVGGRI
jgi:hypothetical protein